MKILKNAGTFEVLINPENVIENIAKVARTCYQSHDKTSPESDEKLVANLLGRGHHAMLEFSLMAVRFNDISRGFTHEMVRHRLCSFAQESTRYVDESDLHVVVPPHKDENEKAHLVVDSYDSKDGKNHYNTLASCLHNNEQTYAALRKNGWKPEDARQVLPIATRSQIVVGANLREWRHIFKMRCDKYAHWEIRGVMLDLLDWCKKNVPLVFDDFEYFTLTDEGNLVAGRRKGKVYARPMPIEGEITEMGDHMRAILMAAVGEK